MVCGQAIYHHDATIDELVWHSDSLHVTDVNGDWHLLSDGDFADGTPPQLATDQQYDIKDHDLIAYTGEGSYHRYPGPSPAHDFVILDEGLLVGTDAGPYLYSEGQYRRYHVPGIAWPQQWHSIAKAGNKLAILAQEELWYYDMQNQLLSRVDSGVRSMTWDSWSALWYAKGSDLYHVLSYVDDTPPRVTWTSVENEQGQHLSPPLTLDKQEGDLTLYYQSLYIPGQLTVFYQLKDNGSWTPVAQPGKIVLPLAEPGQFQILLKAVGMGEAQDFTQPLSIKINDDWVTRSFPFVVGGLLLLMLLSFLSRSRLQGQLRKMSQEKEKALLQLNLEKQKQKVGQLQMNPHFIFNTLNSISGLVALGDTKKARRALSDFSQMMRKLLSASRTDEVKVADEVSFLEHYLRLEQMIRDDSFSYDVAVVGMQAEAVKMPSMIIQPLVENAILHGLGPKSEKGHIEIRFDMREGRLRVTVQDDGIGRDAASAHSTEGHDSAAIDIIRQRIERTGSRGSGALRYEDLKDETGAAKGTRVVVELG